MIRLPGFRHQGSRLALFGVLLALLPGLATPGPAFAGHPDFKQTPGLEYRVGFWKRVYSEVNTNAGLLHDSRDLRVVYETTRSPEGLSRRAHQRITDKRREHYKAILRTLAKGKRTGLSAEEKRVLALFPSGVSNSTLTAARGQIRFQRGQANKFVAGLKRMGRWEGYIRRTLQEHGVPAELVALPHVESSYNPMARSHVGASGLWQFTRSTGRLYMRVDHVVDERRDPFLASVAAARLLKANHKRLKVWPLAITAYNHGAAGMARAERKLGTNDIEKIIERYKSRTFGFASRNFYVSFLAAQEIDADPERYFGPIQKDPPYNPEIVALEHYYRAPKVADALGLGLARLKEANPALLEPVWSNQKHVPKGYGLRVPRNLDTPPARTLLANIPSSERFREQRPDRYYTVRRGDSLSKIANRFNVRESELVALNGLRSRHRIRAGQKLRLPVRGGATVASTATAGSGGVPDPIPADGLYRVKRGDNLSVIARRYGLSVQDLADANGIKRADRIAVGQVLQLPGGARTARVGDTKPGVYVVKRGDNLQSIAARFGTTTSALASHNGLRNRNRIHVGQRLYLPGSPKPGTVAETAPQPPAAKTKSEAPQPPAAKTKSEAPQPPASRSAADASAAPDLPLDSDRYRVRSDDSILAQPGETLGLISSWLDQQPSALRSANPGTSRSISIGARLALDFSRVPKARFEARRVEHHRNLQADFYRQYAVGEPQVVTLSRGDTLWELARRHSDVPLWLILAHNKGLESGKVQPGQKVRIPRVSRRG